MADTHSLLMPVQEKDRVESLDILRGFAILGILIMNIQSFSMISTAYINPSAYGDLSGLNKWTWIFSHLFADQKFMTIFSLLFGAGTILFANKIESKNLSVYTFYYRRTFWLLIIGLLHAYLFWYGDILTAYAVCAFIAILFRKLSSKILLVTGIIILLIPSFLYLLYGLAWNYIPPEAQQGISINWQSTPELINSELAAYRSGWINQMDQRVSTAIGLQTFIFLINIGWRVGGLMLIGMALYKWGILKAIKSRSFYVTSFIVCACLGFPLVAYGISSNFAVDWEVSYSMFIGYQFNYIGSLLIASSYISIIMLLSKTQEYQWVNKGLAAVGRTALSNYLLQTLICTFLFYGHGFGLFGSVERKIQILIVFAIWIFQILLSQLWLKHFRFGPAEWIWRSLTYWKLQPLRRMIK